MRIPFRTRTVGENGMVLRGPGLKHRRQLLETPKVFVELIHPGHTTTDYEG